METERLLLRRWVESDAGELYRLAADPELGPRAGWSPHKNDMESREIIRTIFSAEGMWAIVMKGTNTIVGCVGYLVAGQSNLPLSDGDAEVGYWVGTPYWNCGIGTEALRLVVDYCFDQMGFNRLWGTHFVDNPASGRVMEKCGFTPTGSTTTLPNLTEGGEKTVSVLCLHKPRY